MKIINKPRGSGKTTDLIKISSETGIPILCRDQQMVKFIKDKAKYEFKLDIPNPVYLGMRGLFPHEVLIDELELILRDCLNTNVKVATMTGEVVSDVTNQWMRQ